MKAPIIFYQCIFFTVLMLIVSCKKEHSCEGCRENKNNKPPIAVAGPDQVITLPTDSVLLDGRSSSNPDGMISGYLWTKISGPASFNILKPSDSITKVKALLVGTYQFELKVTDNAGLSAKDTMSVFVNAQTATSNCDNRPIINATLIPIGNLSSARINMQCGAAGSKILFIGGWHPGANYWNEPVPVDIYDFSSNSWSFHSLIPDNPSSSHFRFFAGIASVGNKVLIGGGGDAFGDNQSSKVNIYDASTNSWSNAHLSSERQGLVATTLGNKVFFAGGFGYPDGSNWGEFNTVDIYDNTSNTWSTAILSEARMDLAAASCGNKVYFAGGRMATTISKTIDIYDVSTNSWSVSSLELPRANMTGIAVDDKLYWAEGYNSFTNAGSTLNNNVEVFNTSTGTASIECMAPRRNIVAVKKGNNIIFFTGDFGPGDPRTGIDFEIYNISTKTWSIGKLNQKVYNAAVISVNNTIYVAGGSDGANYFDHVWKLEF